MSKLYKNNTSGVPGVSFDASASKWRAYISFNGKKIRLGNFSSFQDAVDARRLAEHSYDFSSLTSRWSLLSFLGDSSLSARFKLVKLLLDYLLISVDNSHSFSLFALRNWHSCDPFCDSNSLFIFLNFVEHHAPQEFFLYLNGLSFSQISNFLGHSRSQVRRNILNFAQKLKNKFAILL